MPPPPSLPVARHEHSDVGPRAIAFGLVATVLLLAVLGVAAYLAFPAAVHDAPLHPPLPRYPAPALQTAPAADRQAMHRRALARLGATFWVDRAHGIAHIPIADAMRDTVADGIPDWPAP